MRGPLDLRAVEAKCHAYYESDGNDLDLACDCADTAPALLAALRALRTAGQNVVRKFGDDGYIVVDDLAAELERVVDGEPLA